MVRFSGITEDSPAAPRVLIFKEFQQDRLLLVLATSGTIERWRRD
jgi:hypothetical protein